MRLRRRFRNLSKRERDSVLNEGDVKEVTLYWSATEPGLHEVSIIIDPYEQQSEIDKSDNIYLFDFLVEERPISPMLRFKSGSVDKTTDSPSKSSF